MHPVLRSYVFSSLPLVALACNPHPVKEVSYALVQTDANNLPVAVSRDIDVLFVIDNSGTMAQEQANLSRNFAAFVEVFESPEVDANYRIAITTTDAAGCPNPHRGPAQAALRFDSCRARSDAFVYAKGTAQERDEFEQGCLQACPWPELDALTTVPTAIGPGGGKASRPWLERVDGRTNLPPGVETAQALACAGPQGINGCGYEATLESMLHALEQPGDAAGFLRPHAPLLVVFITDEADCSFNPAQREVFSDKLDVWADVWKGNVPTSALCWVAGVSCEPVDGVALACEPADVDRERQRLAAEDAASDAVLHPLARYVDALEAISEAKTEYLRRLACGDASDDCPIEDAPRVFVSLIAGVPTQHRSGDPIPYEEGGATEQENFGIGYGCRREGVAEAVPPVRLAALADAFRRDEVSHVFSVCADDYTPALREIAADVGKELRPACVPGCVADADPTTDALEPACVVHYNRVREDGETERVTLQPCDEGQPPQGAEHCYEALTEASERDPRCDPSEHNLELRVVRSSDAATPAPVVLEVECELSSDPVGDCG